MHKELTIIIPTYERKDKKNSLVCLLTSLIDMEIKNFQVIILNTTHSPRKEYISDIQNIVTKFKKYFLIAQFNEIDLQRVKKQLKNKISKTFFETLHMKSYPNFRNIGLILGYCLETDKVLFLDDDEVAHDKKLTQKAVKFIGKKHKGKIIGGVTGFYLDSNGDYKGAPSCKWEDIFWNKYKYMNKTMKKFIEAENRINETGIALGGIMVLARKMFEKVPFDPYITRGEDIDLTINAKIFGFEFLFDNQLNIRHLPDKEKGYAWKEMRKDIFRFYYKRKKILYLIQNKHLSDFSFNMIAPYPGCFLKRSIYFKSLLRGLLFSFYNLLSFNLYGLKYNLGNIKVALYDALIFAHNHKKHYLHFQKEWMENIHVFKKFNQKILNF